MLELEKHFNAVRGRAVSFPIQGAMFMDDEKELSDAEFRELANCIHLSFPQATIDRDETFTSGLREVARVLRVTMLERAVIEAAVTRRKLELNPFENFNAQHESLSLIEAKAVDALITAREKQ